MTLIKGNAIIGQSGGPTAVINQSLVGVIESLQGVAEIPRIYGARHGTRGVIERDVVDLHGAPADLLERVAQTPSAALGSTRDKPDAAYCERIFATLTSLDVRYFFYVGGNDSSDTCRIVNELSNAAGYELRCFHVPKTIDCDLVMSDHTPGFASAARYVGLAFAGDNLDNAAIPGVKINVVMGRHAGFLTAASALLRDADRGDGPHLVYLPERPVSIDQIVADVDACYTKHGRCQVALSEGLRDETGATIAEALVQGERDAHGNVQLSGSGALGDNIARVLKTKLTPQGGAPPRVRADTFGYPQRCYPDASPVDQHEARQAGRAAATLAKAGDVDGSIAIVRTSSDPYAADFQRVELSDVAAKTRHMPDEFISGHCDVTPDFVEWLRPLVGPLPTIARL